MYTYISIVITTILNKCHKFIITLMMKSWYFNHVFRGQWKNHEFVLRLISMMNFTRRIILVEQLSIIVEQTNKITLFLRDFTRNSLQNSREYVMKPERCTMIPKQRCKIRRQKEEWWGGRRWCWRYELLCAADWMYTCSEPRFSFKSKQGIQKVHYRTGWMHFYFTGQIMLLYLPSIASMKRAQKPLVRRIGKILYPPINCTENIRKEIDNKIWYILATEKGIQKSPYYRTS